MKNVVLSLCLILALGFTGCIGPDGPEYPDVPGNPDGLSWPIDCKAGETCNIGNFADIEESPDGINAFCEKNGIVGHQGTDIGISWQQMNDGVDVYAAADGVVKWVFDGKFDSCPNSGEPDCQAPSNGLPGHTVCTGQGPFCGDGSTDASCGWCFAGGNVVVILHDNVPGVFATRYDHFKRLSITVKAGDRVKRGQKIGQVGSAGASSGPHLHFEVWGTGYYELADPWQGDCSPNDHQSLWRDQNAILH